MKILELLQQRRIWAGLFAVVAFILPMFGVTLAIDADGLTEAFLQFFQALSGLLAVILPILSYFKPKQ